VRGEHSAGKGPLARPRDQAKWERGHRAAFVHAKIQVLRGTGHNTVQEDREAWNVMASWSEKDGARVVVSALEVGDRQDAAIAMKARLRERFGVHNFEVVA